VEDDSVWPYDQGVTESTDVVPSAVRHIALCNGENRVAESVGVSAVGPQGRLLGMSGKTECYIARVMCSSMWWAHRLA